MSRCVRCVHGRPTHQRQVADVAGGGQVDDTGLAAGTQMRRPSTLPPTQGPPTPSAPHTRDLCLLKGPSWLPHHPYLWWVAAIKGECRGLGLGAVREAHQHHIHVGRALHTHDTYDPAYSLPCPCAFHDTNTRWSPSTLNPLYKPRRLCPNESHERQHGRASLTLEAMVGGGATWAIKRSSKCLASRMVP